MGVSLAAVSTQSTRRVAAAVRRQRAGRNEAGPSILSMAPLQSSRGREWQVRDLRHSRAGSVQSAGTTVISANCEVFMLPLAVTQPM
jgi:hypothetical protein